MSHFAKQIVALTIPMLLLGSGCIIDEEHNHNHGTTTTSTTTTTTTTTEPAPAPEPEPAPIPEFVPMMSSVTSEVLDRDAHWETSWQWYTMKFTDVADGYTCGDNMTELSAGSVATIELNGYEIDDAHAACPIGVYDIVPDCDLFEGEACVDIMWRDVDGFEAGSEFATHGTVEVILEEGYPGEPHICTVISTADGHPDLSFSFQTVFEPYELSPHDHHTAAVCTL